MRRHLDKNESIISEIENRQKTNAMSLTVCTLMVLSLVGNHGHARELSCVLLVEALTPA